MSKYDLIPSFHPSIYNCRTCMLAKITMKCFTNNVERDTLLLDLVHNDLCDFDESTYSLESKYMIILIDDH